MDTPIQIIEEYNFKDSALLPSCMVTRLFIIFTGDANSVPTCFHTYNASRNSQRTRGKRTTQMNYEVHYRGKEGEAQGSPITPLNSKSYVNNAFTNDTLDVYIHPSVLGLPRLSRSALEKSQG